MNNGLGSFRSCLNGGKIICKKVRWSLEGGDRSCARDALVNGRLSEPAIFFANEWIEVFHELQKKLERGRKADNNLQTPPLSFDNHPTFSYCRVTSIQRLNDNFLCRSVRFFLSTHSGVGSQILALYAGKGIKPEAVERQGIVDAMW